MFTYRTQVSLRDTDATGVLYFTEQFRMALEAFEAFLENKGFSLKTLVESPYLMPVVHASGDYFAPLTVGDELEITLNILKIGTSSITVGCSFRNLQKQIDVGKVEIVHVVTQKDTKASVPIPDVLRAVLESAVCGA